MDGFPHTPGSRPYPSSAALHDGKTGGQIQKVIASKKAGAIESSGHGCLAGGVSPSISGQRKKGLAMSFTTMASAIFCPSHLLHQAPFRLK